MSSTSGTPVTTPKSQRSDDIDKHVAEFGKIYDKVLKELEEKEKAPVPEAEKENIKNLIQKLKELKIADDKMTTEFREFSDDHEKHLVVDEDFHTEIVSLHEQLYLLQQKIILIECSKLLKDNTSKAALKNLVSSVVKKIKAMNEFIDQKKTAGEISMM